MDLDTPALRRIQFVRHKVKCHRRHYVTEEDVKVVLSRLPEELWSRLRKVHLNDRAKGNRRLGYTTRKGRREVSLCALPVRVSLNGAGSTPEVFGALRGSQWPVLAVRRFMLYDVLLHELGHLQIILPKSKNPNRKFASETLARKFANAWRKKLWSECFDHPDPVHNAPTEEELRTLKTGWIEANLEYKRGQLLEKRGKHKEALPFYQHAVELYPRHALALAGLGKRTYVSTKGRDVEAWAKAREILERALAVDPMLFDATIWLAITLSNLGPQEEARRAFQRAIQLDPYGDIAVGEFADSLSLWGCNNEAETLFRNLMAARLDNFLAMQYYACHLLHRCQAPAEADLRQAVGLLRRVLVLWPGHSYNHYLLALALSKLDGGREEATQQAREAIRLEPSDDRARELLAKLTAAQPEGAC